MDLREERNENKNAKFKISFPKINTCFCCCCFSIDFSVKLSTVILILWFIIVIMYNLYNELFNFVILMYMIVIYSAFIFFTGISRQKSFLLNQYLVVFFIFLIYYLYYCISTIVASFSVTGYRDELVENIKVFVKDASPEKMNTYLKIVRILIIIFTLIPYSVYIYYYIVVGSYIDSIKEDIEDKSIMMREIEENIE